MSLLLILMLAPGQAPAVTPVDPDKEDALLPPVGPDYRPYMFRGRVVAVTKTGCFVKPEGVLSEYEVERQPDGLCKKVAIYRQDNTLPPREFVFGDVLFADRLAARTMRSGHNATDVRPGDIVVLMHPRTDGVPVCYTLTIFRRPGGLVPPAIGDDRVPLRERYSTRLNAQQFVEEQVMRVAVPRLFRKFRW